jgi:hypothetical protein
MKRQEESKDDVCPDHDPKFRQDALEKNDGE